MKIEIRIGDIFIEDVGKYIDPHDLVLCSCFAYEPITKKCQKCVGVGFVHIAGVGPLKHLFKKNYLKTLRRQAKLMYENLNKN